MLYKRILSLLMLAALALAFAGGLLACAETEAGDNDANYLETARENYEKGMSELRDENFLEAAKLFNYVKSKFPYSRYATLAELRLADSQFAEEKWIEAIDSYRMFLKAHPQHPEVESGYVAFRISQCFVEQMPSDWFIAPPSYQKDQGAVKDALRELNSFIKIYAHSTYLEKAKELQRNCVRRLAEHELNVARFYLGRDKPRGAILRLETLLHEYPEAGVDPAVMLLLGQTYLKMNERNKARETFASLMDKYPGDPYAKKAALFLRYLEGKRE